MKWIQTWGLTVTGLLLCQIAFNQQPAVEVPANDIVINQRMISIYNNMLKSSDNTKSVNFFFDNYTFNQVTILFNHHREKDFLAMDKSAIDAFITEKKVEEEKFLNDPDFSITKKRKI